MHNNTMLQRTRRVLNSLSAVLFVYGFTISAQKISPSSPQMAALMPTFLHS